MMSPAFEALLKGLAKQYERDLAEARVGALTGAGVCGENCALEAEHKVCQSSQSNALHSECGDGRSYFHGDELGSKVGCRLPQNQHSGNAWDERAEAKGRDVDNLEDMQKMFSPDSVGMPSSFANQGSSAPSEWRMWFVATPSARIACENIRVRMDALLNRLAGAEFQPPGLESETPQETQYFFAGPSCEPTATMNQCGVPVVQVRNLIGVSSDGCERWLTSPVREASLFTKLPWVTLRKTREKWQADRAFGKFNGLTALEITEIQLIDTPIASGRSGTMLRLENSSYLTVALMGAPLAITSAITELQLDTSSPTWSHVVPNLEANGLIQSSNVSYARFILISLSQACSSGEKLSENVLREQLDLAQSMIQKLWVGHQHLKAQLKDPSSSAASSPRSARYNL